MIICACRDNGETWGRSKNNNRESGINSEENNVESYDKIITVLI